MHKEEAEDKTPQAFLEELSKISEVEKKSLLLIEAAQKKAQEILQQANIEASKITSEAAEESLKIKNEIIAKNKKIADNQAKAILNNATKKAEKIKNLNLSNSEISSLLELLKE